MTKIKKDGFYMVCESVHRILAGVNALLDANIRIAMIKGSLGIITSSKCGYRQAISPPNVSFFIICKVKLLLYATFISQVS